MKENHQGPKWTDRLSRIFVADAIEQPVYISDNSIAAPRPAFLFRHRPPHTCIHLHKKRRPVSTWYGLRLHPP